MCAWIYFVLFNKEDKDFIMYGILESIMTVSHVYYANMIFVSRKKIEYGWGQKVRVWVGYQ